MNLRNAETGDKAHTLRRQVAVSGDKLPKVEHVELRQLVSGDKQLVSGTCLRLELVDSV